MSKLRVLIPTFVLGAAVIFAFSAAGASEDVAATAPQSWHGHRHGLMGRVLNKLDLTADQKTQIKSIYAQAKPQMQSLLAAS